MTYANREVFARAPLAIVTAEIRLNYEPRLNDAATRDQFAEKIRQHFPVLENQTLNNFTIQDGAAPQVETIHQIRATTLNKSVTTALNQTSLSVSMSGATYGEFQSFAELVELAAHALSEIVDSVVVQRVGLRFIDEVRVPSPPDHSDGWEPWINQALLAPVEAYGMARADMVRGNVVYEASEERRIAFSWGEFVGAGVVGPDLPFHRPDTEQTKMFLLDVDSAWEPADFVLLQNEDIRNILTMLHDPIGEIFQWSITDAARELFRG
ncbi:TIGR04255 family protein [Arthrobacter sp. H35-D1]|uniref:TIGR04255 family protein n=1 Tax=Arthrobacter sp. H35-D1 TaxID=3046202 RepID=UPI0024B98403|nr:TIGR04255 family protein [Arthrobacter sp. H35-D1]MDJ0312715.1 TIGR04255 family protein [Arthrobacter sp. H35-D1]